MCVEAMDTRSKHIKTHCLRKTMKPGSKLRWKPLHVFTEEEDEALKQCRASSVRTIRKYLHREQKRAQLAKLAKVLGDIEKEEKGESVCEESPAAACNQPSGAMAPRNTTQYLMGKVYEDMKTTFSHETPAQLYSESISQCALSTLDSDYESCLAFQQRDFEELFNPSW